MSELLEKLPTFYIMIILEKVDILQSRHFTVHPLKSMYFVLLILDEIQNEQELGLVNSWIPQKLKICDNTNFFSDWETLFAHIPLY